MAVIRGRTLLPDPRTLNPTRRVVVKLQGAVALGPPLAMTASSAAADVVTRLAQKYPGINVRPYFADHLVAGISAAAPPAAGGIGALGVTAHARYLAVDVPEGVAPEEVARTAQQAQGVEKAYPEGGPTPPPVNPVDDPRSGSQGYLDAAPDGINARWVWDSGVADGSGIGFVDLEQGWTLHHEDLIAAGITIVSGQNLAYHGHGTAVLGEVTANDNTRGGIGIAPAVTTRVVSQWRADGSYNTAEAILDASAQMQPGDVLLLEAQTTYVTAPDVVPVEVEDHVFDAIRTAVARGVVVIEAAGNGQIDLDQFQDVNGKFILNRTSPDFRDSGAVMVGAASSGSPHSRLSFSNFGSRVDCFAWGEAIDTCGDGWTGDDPHTYATDFGGTSGASPIVSGAALLLQSMRLESGLSPYDPARLRELLSSPIVNTPSSNPPIDLIGVMPDLRAIVERERSAGALNANLSSLTEG